MSDDSIGSDETEFWDRRQDLSLSPITKEELKQRAIGRSRHLVLLARIKDEDVVSQFEPVLEQLGDFDCFASEPARNLHITVKVLGNVVEDPNGEGEFSTQDEHELVSSLRSVLSDAIAFTVDFPRLNLFPSVVYSEVADNGRFMELNRLVCEVPAVPVWSRDEDGFIPHLTLGQFTKQDGYDRLLEYLEDNRSLAVPSTTIRELELVALDLSEGRFPPYETVATYNLSEGE